MSDDLEVTGGVGGMDRRDFIRKGAMVGGMAGMVWAAPMISSIGRPAFAGTPDDPDGQEISNVAFVLGNGVTERYKFDGDTIPCQAESADTVRPCVDGLKDDDYEAQYDEWCAASYTSQDLLEEIQCTDPHEWTIIAKDGYTVRWAVVKTGVQSDHCRLFLPENPVQTLVVNTTGGVETIFRTGMPHHCS